MTAAAVYWTCIGDTDRTAEKHTRATGHTTITGVDPEALARMRERVAKS